MERMTRLLLSLSIVLVLTAFWVVSRSSSDRGIQPVVLTGSPIKVAAAGDIACAARDEPTVSACQMEATARLIESKNPALVLALGDLQYPSGSLEQFKASFDKTWGRFKDKIRPVPGNHEYLTFGAIDYFNYFDDQAGEKDKGYYSFEAGEWHVVALNSNCSAVGGCGEESEQAKWLINDLSANPTTCTLAFWHHPRFSSGTVHGSDGNYDTFWRVLAGHKVDVVLNGHEHNYERFASQNGLSQFVVGTGGKSLYQLDNPVTNSEIRIDSAFGVLFLTLESNSYSWEFVSIDRDVLDSGSSTCH